MENHKFQPRKHLIRYSFSLAKSFMTPTIIYFTVVGNLILLCGAFLFFQVESGHNDQLNTWIDALWWAFSTVTTVGYGDIVPHTTGGRVIGVVLMVTGAVLFFGFTAILMTAFTALTTEEVKETEKLTKNEYEQVMRKLEELEKKLDQR